MIEQLFKDIIKTEGGYVNHLNDRGGPTKYGITQATLTNHLGRHADENDVKAITKTEAADIYEQHYYHYPRIDQLPQIIQPVMTDMSVNHGPRRAIKLLQQELKDQAYKVGKIDGIIGKKTIKSTEQAVQEQQQKLIDALVERRLLFYKSIIERDPSQKVFWFGWMKRAESFRPDIKQA